MRVLAVQWSQARAQALLTLPQVNFAASMALLLGVPIPFGSIGRLLRELWLLSGQPEAATTFRMALTVNAWQAQPVSKCQAPTLTRNLACWAI